MCAAKSSKEANRDHQYEPGLAVKPVTNKAMKNVYKPVINTKLSSDGWCKNNEKWPKILLISLPDNLGHEDEKLPDINNTEMETQVGCINTNI